MTVDWPFFCGYKSLDVVWFRVLGFGLSFRKTQLNFSERNGYVPIRWVINGWRIKVLKRQDFL